MTSRHLLKFDSMSTVNPPLKELLEFRSYDEVIHDLYEIYHAFLKTAPSPDSACEKHFTMHMIQRALFDEYSKDIKSPDHEQE